MGVCRVEHWRVDLAVSCVWEDRYDDGREAAMSRVVLWSFRRCLDCGAIGPHYCSARKKAADTGCPINRECSLWGGRGCTYFTYVDEPFDEDCEAANLLHRHGLLRGEQR